MGTLLQVVVVVAAKLEKSLKTEDNCNEQLTLTLKIAKVSHDHLLLSQVPDNAQ